MLSLMFILPLSIFLFYKILLFFEKYSLYTHPRNKKYVYTLFFLRNDDVHFTFYLYSNYEKHSLNKLLEHLWDSDTKKYIFKQNNLKRIVGSVDQLKYCQSFVEKRRLST